MKRLDKVGQRYAGTLSDYCEQSALAEKQGEYVIKEVIRRGAVLQVFQDTIFITDEKSIDILNEVWAEVTKK